MNPGPEYRRVLWLMLALIVNLIGGAVGTGVTLTMYVVTGGRHPGWLQATNWIKWAILVVGLTLIVLIVRAQARRWPPS